MDRSGLARGLMRMGSVRGFPGAGMLSLGTLAPGALAHDIPAHVRERVRDADWLDFIWTGAEHMLTGYDHLLFLLGVVFFLSRFLTIVKVVTAFTLGHTIVLIAATCAGISANHHLVDAVIALTVMYKGFENLDGFRTGLGIRPPDPVLMVFGFGLIHGLGLSTRLQELTLASEAGVLAKILWFNVGVELGQIAALLVMVVVVEAWRRTTVWQPLSRAINAGLIFTGFLLLLLQLHGYAHETEVSDSAPVGWHSHDGGPVHSH